MNEKQTRTPSENFRRHQITYIYIIVNIFLLVLDVLDGGGWWFFYPLIIWVVYVAVERYRLNSNLTK